jgi:hypothetical protein
VITAFNLLDEKNENNDFTQEKRTSGLNSDLYLLTCPSTNLLFFSSGQKKYLGD